MLNLPPDDRTDSSGGSDASSERALAVRSRAVAATAATITASAEAVLSWNRRLSHHHMTSCEV